MSDAFNIAWFVRDGKVTSLLKTKADSSCENCGHDQLESFIDKDDHRLLHCPKCLLYQKGIPCSEELYEQSYHSGYAARRDNKIITARIRLGALTKFLPRTETPLKMLDIGCSIGATVEAGRRMGWQATGVDVSGSAVNYCVEHGLDCQKINGLELPFEDNTFDIVTNWHVIEHVTDVKATLAEWFRVVRPGGLMVLETPDSQCFKAKKLGAKYAKFWPKGHLYTFTHSNMSSLLEQTGFEVLPSPVVGKLNALPLHLTAYAVAYRGWRKLNRAAGLCKSIEVCSRKPTEAESESISQTVRKAA